MWEGRTDRSVIPSLEIPLELPLFCSIAPSIDGHVSNWDMVQVDWSFHSTRNVLQAPIIRPLLWSIWDSPTSTSSLSYWETTMVLWPVQSNASVHVWDKDVKGVLAELNDPQFKRAIASTSFEPLNVSAQSMIRSWEMWSYPREIAWATLYNQYMFRWLHLGMHLWWMASCGSSSMSRPNHETVDRVHQRYCIYARRASRRRMFLLCWVRRDQTRCVQYILMYQTRWRCFVFSLAL